MSDLRIDDVSRDRYHSLQISSVWDLSKIRSASALVVGVGALGNEVSKNLAMMGIKAIYVLDRDRVETANLSRSVFFREGDHGSYKTEVIAKRLRELNPEVEIHELTGDLEDCLGLGLLRRMDLVFACLDSRLARRSLNRMCQKVGRAWIDGAMEDLFGTVSVYIPGEGACYECGLTPQEQTMLAQATSCRGIAIRHLAAGKVPTTSTMGSIIAAIQVQEGLKLLHGMSVEEVAGACIKLDCMSNELDISRRSYKPYCTGHFSFGEIEPVAGCTNANTPKQLLEKFSVDTGEVGLLELGREVVVSAYCPKCRVTTYPAIPLKLMTEKDARCEDSSCEGELRILETTHRVSEEDFYAHWSLSRLGVPAQDILEIKGIGTNRWYELSGNPAEGGHLEMACVGAAS